MASGNNSLWIYTWTIGIVVIFSWKLQ